MSLSDDQQARRKRLVNRRHPRYFELLPHWNFLIETYNGGRGWFNQNLFKYIKEGEGEFLDRQKRAYRFNHTREVVDLLNKYIFKAPVQRNKDDASQAVQDFWKDATLDHLPIDQFIRQCSTKASIFGRCWVVVDSSFQGGTLSVAEEKDAGGRIYAYVVPPQLILDLSYDDEGVLNWVLIMELHRDDEDPYDSTGLLNNRYRLWTRNEWVLYEEQIPAHEMASQQQAAGVLTPLQGPRVTYETQLNFQSPQAFQTQPLVNGVPSQGQITYVQIGKGEHNLGRVPVFPLDNIVTADDPYTAPAFIQDVAYLDRAVANYLSNLDAIIQDQTFSQLAMPAQGLMPGEENYQKMLEMGTKRVFIYDGEGGVRPEYLSPDPRQAGMILQVIHKIINEIYHSIGIAGERTKSDNSMGIDNSSGVAKAYDFERVNALLTSKADTLQRCEEMMIDLVNAWTGQKNDVDDSELVKYADDFDVRGLFDEFEVAARLSLIEAPDGIRQEQMKMVIDKLFPRLAKDLKTQLINELKDWPPQPPEMMGPNGQPVDQTQQNTQKVADRQVAQDLVGNRSSAETG